MPHADSEESSLLRYVLSVLGYQSTLEWETDCVQDAISIQSVQAVFVQEEDLSDLLYISSNIVSLL